MQFSKDMKRCNHLTSEIEAVYHSMAKHFDMGDCELLLLYSVYGNGGNMLLRDITASCGMSKQTANSVLRKLEKTEMIRLEPVGAKNKRVCLTEHGTKRCSETVHHVITAENEVFASWPQEDVERYIALTERFANDMKEKAKEIYENDK